MKRFKNLLCVIESGKECGAVLGRAAALARSNQASLTVVEVIPCVRANTGTLVRGRALADLQGEIVEDHARKLQSLVQSHRGSLELGTEVLVGTRSWRSSARCCDTGAIS